MSDDQDHGKAIEFLQTFISDLKHRFDGQSHKMSELITRERIEAAGEKLKEIQR